MMHDYYCCWWSIVEEMLLAWLIFVWIAQFARSVIFSTICWPANCQFLLPASSFLSVFQFFFCFSQKHVIFILHIIIIGIYITISYNTYIFMYIYMHIYIYFIIVPGSVVCARLPFFPTFRLPFATAENFFLSLISPFRWEQNVILAA